MQIYQLYFSLLNGITDLGAAEPSFEERPQTFTECSLFTQFFTASTIYCVVDTAPDFDLSRERIHRSIGKSVIKITSQSKGAEREISSRAAHRSRPESYAFSLAIHTDFLASCFLLIICASDPSSTAWG